MYVNLLHTIYHTRIQLYTGYHQEMNVNYYHEIFTYRVIAAAG
jgi:hypothetical protein